MAKEPKLTIDEINAWADENYDTSFLAQTIFEYWDSKDMHSLKSCITYEKEFDGFTAASLDSFDKEYTQRWESVDLTTLT